MYRAVELGHVDTAQFLIRLSRLESTSSPILGTSHSPTTATQSRYSHGLTELHELVLHTEEPLPAAFTVRLVLTGFLCCNCKQNSYDVIFLISCFDS